MLEVRQLDVSYGAVTAVRGISVRVIPGAVTAIIGSNGAGKSTLLKAISRLVPIRGGSIWWEGREISRCTPVDVVRTGIVMVPEGRGILPYHSVSENLELGAYVRRDRAVRRDIEEALDSFPVLRRRRGQMAGTLSGGEQQMLAIARAVLARPRLLMLDEPSLGLAPKIVQDIFEVIARVARGGTTVLLVEQNVAKSLRLAEYAYVLDSGQVVREGKSQELLNDEGIAHTYLGAGSHASPPAPRGTGAA